MIKDKGHKTNSQSFLARDVIKDKGITLVPQMGGFMVRVRCGKLYAVELFQKRILPMSFRRKWEVLSYLSCNKVLICQLIKTKIVNLTLLRKTS